MSLSRPNDIFRLRRSYKRARRRSRPVVSGASAVLWCMLGASFGESTRGWFRRCRADMSARSSWFQSSERGGEAERHSERLPREGEGPSEHLQSWNASSCERQLAAVGTPLAMTPSSLVVGGTADAESAGPAA